MRLVSAILHSSDRINAGSAVLMLEKNCHFLPLKKKLGRLKRDCNDMGQLMAALIKYADSDGTKDPESHDEKAGKGNGTAVPRGNSITRQVMGTMVSTRPIVIQILWPIPVRRIMVSVVRGGHPLSQVGQVPPSSSF